MKHPLLKGALLALCIMLIGSLGLAEAGQAAAGQEAGRESGALRVWLKSLGEPSELTLRLAGSYSIDGNAGLFFERGTEITASARNGAVWLRCGGLQMNMGAGVTLTRHQADGENGLYIDGSARGNLYCGSLELNAEGAALQPVLVIDVEEYLKGVLPFEMNDAFPLEALKAQAVAARTYALSRRAERGAKNYDLVDTPADQVFFGFDPAWQNAAAAVEATRGVCGRFNGRYAACYYTATNGGQTALPGDVLSAPGGDAYLNIHDDPYDLENPLSPVSTLAFRKNLSDAPAQLTQWLAEAAAERLGAMGYSEETGDIRPDRVISLTPHTTKFGPENRMYQYVRVTYALSARPMEPVYTELTFEERIREIFTGVKIEREVVGMKPGAWTQLDEEFTYDLTVYGQLKNELGMKLSGLDCELVTVIEEEDVFALQLRRYGHGVGLSQRGAQIMAGQYGMRCEEILAFYYPGLTFEAAAFDDEILPPIPELPAATPVRESLPEPGEGESIATVRLSTAWSTLNVRSAPSTDAPILAELKNGVQVVAAKDENGWTRVRTGSVEGYVSSQYLTVDGG